MNASKSPSSSVSLQRAEKWGFVPRRIRRFHHFSPSGMILIKQLLDMFNENDMATLKYMFHPAVITPSW